MDDPIGREIKNLRTHVQAHRGRLMRRRTRMRLDEIESRLDSLETLVRVLYRVLPNLRR